ncbi:MAG TPA: anti-sigma factor [Vicinamibacterales bacterium]|nr:anti-sigma factor [Vicinamibacterales bacterium]
MNCHEIERQLDAYIDGELAQAESEALQSHIAGCAACSQRLAERQSLGRLVRQAPYYPAPDRLRLAVQAARKPSRLTPTVLAWAASILLAVSVGGVMIAGARRARTAAESSASIANDIVGGHVRALMGDHLFDVRSTDQHTVKPWFLGKLDFSPPVKDTASVGFPLIGGRLDYIAGRPVAALVYQRRQHTINVFVWPETQPAPAAAESLRGFQVRHWTRDQMAFWAVSDLNAAELDEFATALQQ